MKNIHVIKLLKESGKSYVELPDEVVKEVRILENQKLFLTVIDSIVQISNSEPYCGISVLTLDKARHKTIKE
jgi:hypothetical protein